MNTLYWDWQLNYQDFQISGGRTEKGNVKNLLFT